MNKKGLSPLVATALLVVFALIIGTITMSWGKSYVEGIGEEGEAFEDTVIISIEDVDTPLKKLQLEYITGKISEEEYTKKEKELIK